MGFERHLILGKEGDPFGPQEIALKLLQPERAPTDGQASIAIDDAMPGDIRRTDSKRPSHHARGDARPTERRDITVGGHSPPRDAPHEAVDFGETSSPHFSKGGVAPSDALSLTRSHDVTPPRERR